MAVITGIAVVRITVHALVIVIGLLLVVVLVTLNTTEGREIVGRSMTFTTHGPFVFMLSTVNREIHPVVVKRGRVTGILIMTERTIMRETRR